MTTARDTIVARRVQQRAFTLVELITSMVIMSILLGAVMSVMVIASHAIPANTPELTTLAQAHTVLLRIADEVATADAVELHDEHTLRLRVPDRDGDGADDVLQYSWSGTVGDPLLGTYNELGPQVLVDQIDSVTFATLLDEPVEVAGDGTRTIGPVELAAHVGGMGVSATMSVGAGGAVGAMVKPDLPETAMQYTIESITLLLQRGTAPYDHGFTVVVGGAELLNGKLDALQSETVAEADLEYLLSEHAVTFTSPAAISTGSPIVVALLPLEGERGDGIACSAAVELGSSESPNARLMFSADSGESWAMTGTGDLLFKLTGSYTEKSDDAASKQAVRAVRIRLDLDGPQPRLETVAEVWNEPLIKVTRN